jgi:hypothetical protein
LPDKLGKEVDRTPNKRLFARRLQVGVLLSPHEMKSIADFLNQQLKVLEQKTEDK